MPSGGSTAMSFVKVRIMFKKIKTMSTKYTLAFLISWSFLVHVSVGMMTGPPNFWEHYAGRNYLDLAEALTKGQGYLGIRCCMPLYPITLSVLLDFFDHLSWPLLLFHACVGTFTVYLSYRVARDLFSPTVAAGAGLLLSIHPYLLKLDMQLIDTGLAVMLVTLGVFIFLKAWLNKSALKLYALAGGILALATLTRPTAMVYTAALGFAVIVRFAARRDLYTAVKSVIALWLTWSIVMSPWWVHNYLKYHRFIPLTTHGGANLLKGHSRGYIYVHPNYDTDWFPQYVNWPPKPDDDPSGYLFNKLCTHRAIEYIIHHPIKALVTDLRKVMWLYTWHKVPRSLVNSKPRWDPLLGRVIDEGNPHPSLQDRVYSIYWVPTLFLFLYGIIGSRNSWRDLVPLYSVLIANALIVGLTFADTRYRLEVDPCITALAAYGGLRILTRFARCLRPITSHN